MPKFTCSYCAKQFNANFTLRRHVRSFHEGAVLPEVQRGRKPKNCNEAPLVTCALCDMKLRNKKALGYHRRRKHSQVTLSKRSQLEKRTMEFKSMTEFLKWKMKEEDETFARFVKIRPDCQRSRQQITCRSYYCHRSGRYIAKGRGIRHPKLQGSCKIGRMCPAAMFIKIFSAGSVVLSYYPDHRSHNCDIAHIRMCKEQREVMAAKLADGTPFDDVLGCVHEAATASGLKAQKRKMQHEEGTMTPVVNVRSFSLQQVQSRSYATAADLHCVGDIDNRQAVGLETVPESQKPALSNILDFQDRLVETKCRDHMQFIVSAESAWTRIRTAMDGDLTVAKVMSGQMNQLASLAAALLRKPEASLEVKPVYKKVALNLNLKRLDSRRTKLTATKQSTAVSAAKVFLHRTRTRRAVDGRVISHQTPACRDFDCNVTYQGVNSEHSYAVYIAGCTNTKISN